MTQQTHTPMPCGCLNLDRCSLHAAAPALLEALRTALTDVGDFADPGGEFEPTMPGLMAVEKGLSAAIALATPEG